MNTSELIFIFGPIGTTITLILGGFLLPWFVIFFITDIPFNFMTFSGVILLLLGIVSYCRINGTTTEIKHRIILATAIAMVLLWLLMRGTDYHPILAIIYAGMAIVFGVFWIVIKQK